MARANQSNAVLVAVVVTIAIVAGSTLAGSAVASKHKQSQAADMSDKANFTIAFPHNTDHYPGDQNKENGSIEYYAAGAEAFAEMGAEDGIWMDTVIIDASWIDYTACSTENTAAYGIDRGNNNSGTKTDEDLVEHQKKSTFRDDGITINFYDWSDFGGDPPYLAAEDAQVAAQGYGSNAGPCLTLTSEPGWYQIQGFLNGTAANGDCTEEGNSDCEPDNKDKAGANVNSNYVYVCECDSEEEAREQLGPPPNEDGGSSTPTDSGTDTPTDSGTDTPTATEASGAGATKDTSTPTSGDDSSSGTSTDTHTEAMGNDGGDGAATPTAGGGAGFGAILAITALLGSALLLYRRR